MRVRCAWQSVYTDISRLGPRRKLYRGSALPRSGPRDGGDVALVQDDGTLIDRSDEWLLTEATRKFYASRGDVDDYHFVSFFPQSRPQSKAAEAEPDFNAYHVGVFNDIQGIGKGFRDRRRDYRQGGSRHLQSVHLFPPPGELPEDPKARIPGNNDSTLSLIAQEVGHRWSSFVWFRDRERGDLPSSALLGRDRSHWSFFLETGGSPLEGNHWQSKGDAFVSSGKSGGYCELDLYLMGLLEPEEVKPLRLIVNHKMVKPADPTVSRAAAARVPAMTPSSRPVKGATVRGDGKEITIRDVIDFEGVRFPRVAEAPKKFRHAFALLLRRDEEPREADIEKLNKIRVRWEEHFRTATGNRGEVDTHL